jgi:hypothetical protein
MKQKRMKENKEIHKKTWFRTMNSKHMRPNAYRLRHIRDNKNVTSFLKTIQIFIPLMT